MNAYLSFFSDQAALLVRLTVGHILLSVVAVVVSIVIALPLGAWIGHLHRGSFLVVNAGNVLRSLPTLAIVAIVIALFGFGFVNITIALVILAFPLVLTNTFTAVEGVDPGTVEAARGMGMTGWQNPHPRRAAVLDPADLQRYPHLVGLRRRHRLPGDLRRCDGHPR